ncbi:hypothetical protein ACFQZZ_14590 [Nocardia sp. GCM10030253]
MRARTAGFVVAVVSVGLVAFTAPHVVGITLMLLGAVALFRSTRRWGVRR